MDQGAQPRVLVPAQPGMAVVVRAQRQVQPGGQRGRRMRRPQPVRDQGLLPVREPPRVGGRVFSYQVHRLAQHVVLQPLPADDRLERLRVVRQERIVQVHATASLPRAGRDRPLLAFHDPPAHGADSRPALARRGTQAHAPTIRQHRAARTLSGRRGRPPLCGLKRASARTHAARALLDGQPRRRTTSCAFIPRAKYSSAARALSSTLNLRPPIRDQTFPRPNPQHSVRTPVGYRTKCDASPPPTEMPKRWNVTIPALSPGHCGGCNV
jgi:hypothetical protein